VHVECYILSTRAYQLAADGTRTGYAYACRLPSAPPQLALASHLSLSGRSVRVTIEPMDRSRPAHGVRTFRSSGRASVGRRRRRRRETASRRRTLLVSRRPVTCINMHRGVRTDCSVLPDRCARSLFLNVPVGCEIFLRFFCFFIHIFLPINYQGFSNLPTSSRRSILLLLVYECI
jgi:hypothetical protein